MNDMGLVMSLSGSVTLVLYFLFYPLTKKCFSVGWHRFVLIAVVVYNLFPFPYFKYRILDFIYFVFQIEWPEPEVVTSFSNEAIVQLAPDKILLSYNMKVFIIIKVLLVSISIITICIQLGRYIYIKNLFIKKMVDCPLFVAEGRLLEKMKVRIKVRQKHIRLGKSSFIDSPIVIGVFVPIIIIPSDKCFGEEELTFIFGHELCHIKNYDLFWRFMILAVIFIHWYNPLSYLLYYQFNKISEISCDLAVTENFNLETKKRYCQLLIDLSTKVEVQIKKRFMNQSLVEHNKSMIQKRVYEVIKVRKKFKKLSLIVAAILLLASNLTVFAYENPIVIEDDNAAVNGLIDGAYISYDSALDNCFIDVMGNVYPYEPEKETELICAHVYQSGFTTKHVVYRNGGCQTLLYNCDRCKKCGKTIAKDQIQSEKFGVCPH